VSSIPITTISDVKYPMLYDVESSKLWNQKTIIWIVTCSMLG